MLRFGFKKLITFCLFFSSFLLLLNANTTFAGSVTLAWDAPTTNVDGSQLTDLAGYKIYYSTSTGNYTQSIDINNPATTTYQVDNLTDGTTYYFSIIAYDTSNNESMYSNEVCRTIGATTCNSGNGGGGSDTSTTTTSSDTSGGGGCGIIRGANGKGQRAKDKDEMLSIAIILMLLVLFKLRNWRFAMKKILIVFFLLFLPMNLYAATLEVGQGRTYSTIQAAVNAAQAGDTVLVYPGTYNEGIFIPNGKSGTSTSPITIRAVYPARKPLNGETWADNSSTRSIIDATGRTAGIYNDYWSENDSQKVKYIIIDGFYITGGNYGGIYFVMDRDIWVRNNMVVNSGYIGGENYGAYVFNRTTDSLIQNNYAEYSLPIGTSAFLFDINAANLIVEYNEGYLNSGDYSGRGIYAHANCTNLIFRYNYIYFNNRARDVIFRYRDFVNLTFVNNYIKSTAPQWFGVIHENTDAGLIENHKINKNTFLYDGGFSVTTNILGLGYMNSTEVKNNIFMSGVNGGYGIGRAWTQPSYSVTIDSNIRYNLANLVDPAVLGYTETNTQNINPNINSSTGCASSVDNNIYGANLDVSQIPYKKCDGTLYPFAGKFGYGADSTIPSAPLELKVIY